MIAARQTWILAAHLALALGVSGCGGGGIPGGPTNAAPLVADGEPGVTTFRAGEEVIFTVVVTDPEGDRVSLALLNPEPGMAVAPIVDGASPQTLRVRWLVPPTASSG